MKLWIKEQIELLLSKFGYIPKSELEEEKRQMAGILLDHEELFMIYGKIFEIKKDDNSGMTSYTFKKPNVKPTRERVKGEVWHDYWVEQYEHHYLSWYLRDISLYPKVLQSLLYEISVYDWDSVETHMKKTNWFWGNLNRSPNRQELIESAVSLLHSSIYEFDRSKDNKETLNFGGVSSGGFKVSVVEGKVKIEFDFEL